MRKRENRLLLVGFAAVLLVAILVVGLKQRDVAFNLGVQPSVGIISLKPGQHACQRNIGLGAEFDSVQVYVGTYYQRGGELQAKVISGKETVSFGTLNAGYLDNSWQDIRLTRAVTADPFDLCVYNTGRKTTALYGGPPLAAPNSFLEFREKRLDSDISLIFGGPEQSLLSKVPDMLTRASRFNLAGPTVLGVLLFGVVIAVPVLLVAAFGAARDD